MTIPESRLKEFRIHLLPPKLQVNLSHQLTNLDGCADPPKIQVGQKRARLKPSSAVCAVPQIL